MRPSRRSCLRSSAAILLLAALVSGCVTRGVHQDVLVERDTYQAESKRLASRVQLLEASNESLSTERIDLIAQVEDLRASRDGLALQVEELSARRADLEADLARRESEVAEHRDEIGSLRETYDGLVSDLETEVTAGRIQIEQLKEGIRVNLSQEILFPLGSARVSGSGRVVLGKVAGRLTGLENPIEVQGHTDNLKIGGALAKLYPTNWELGGARAARVVRLLGESGVQPNRMRAVSFGATRPSATNETAEGRARNRRIEIRLLPVRPSVALDPAPASPSAVETESPPASVAAETRSGGINAEVPATRNGAGEAGAEADARLGAEAGY